MSIKPFSEIVSEELEEKEAPRPFVGDASGGVKVEEINVEKILNEQQIGFIKRNINFLGSSLGVLSVTCIFMLVAVVVDALQTIEVLLTSNSMIDTLYLIALVFLGLSLSIFSYKNYIQMKSIKNAKKIQKFFSQQKTNPDKTIIPATLNLLKRYKRSKNIALTQKVKLLQTKINESHDYQEIYTSLDRDVINIIDLEVQNRIKVASIQAAISTAISPLAVLDVGIIIWRSVLLTKEIAELYGFKPGWLSTVILLKHGAFNIFFAGAAELATEYTTDLTESSIISKVSISAGQGVANGILLARLGFGVMKACRPLPMRVKRDSFMKGFYSSLKNSFNTSKKNSSKIVSV